MISVSFAKRDLQLRCSVSEMVSRSLLKFLLNFLGLFRNFQASFDSWFYLSSFVRDLQKRPAKKDTQKKDLLTVQRDEQKRQTDSFEPETGPAKKLTTVQRNIHRRDIMTLLYKRDLQTRPTERPKRHTNETNKRNQQSRSRKKTD